MSYYNQAFDKIGHTYQSIIQYKSDNYPWHCGEPWRIVLKASNGLHTVDLTSEWSLLCFVSWLYFKKDYRKHDQFWQPICKVLSKHPRGFEPRSGMDFIESLAEYFVNNA